MANETKAKSKVDDIKEEKVEIRMDEKITLTSIAPWDTHFKRMLSIGDVTIPGKGFISNLSREEVLAQARSGNKLLSGIDGLGTHATLYIEDEWTRRELDYDTDDSKQVVVSKYSVKEMFDIKTISAFKKAVEKNIVTRAEKHYLLSMIKALKINDYEKIAFCEEHCGAKLSTVQ